MVTGASAGVGRAVARAFAREGASVALLARGQDGLEGARAEVEAAGGKALVIPTDVAEYEQVEAAAARAESELGPIDVWVNNAMTTVFAEFADVTPEEFRRATEVTYLGTVWGTRAALERMLPRDHGTIVLVGSAIAYRGIPLQTPYSGAKAGIRGFFDALRCELRHRGSGVHLTMVQLPAHNTPQFDHCRAKMPKKPMPVPPIYQPEVAADAVVWAARNRRREVYVGGSAVKVILGSKLAPGFAEWYLARTGYDAQQTDEPLGEERAGNLFEPSAGDPGAQGAFGAQARSSSRQFWLTKNRAWLGLAAAAAVAVLGGRRSH